MTEYIMQKDPYPLGARREGNEIRFSFVSRADCCGILLYDRVTGKKLDRIPCSGEDRTGNVYCRTVTVPDAEAVSWLFYEGNRLIPDRRGRAFPGRKKSSYGKEAAAEDFRAAFVTGVFDWGQDRFPRIPYDRSVCYCLHVRGFTKHSSSNVVHKGTFAGLTEKIPYLKEAGITTLELQPAYEFTEIPMREEYVLMPACAMGAGTGSGRDGGAPSGEFSGFQENKLNYWGYKNGYYYAPKASYAASGDPAAEFKTMVRTLHENGMELVMQFYFPEEVKCSEIPEILRFWVLEYHVDGFHLMGQDPMADFLASDDFLADTKLWYYRFDTGRIYGRDEEPAFLHAAEYNDSWYYDMRKFLKGDGGMLDGVLYHMGHIPAKAGNIHYLTNYYGFTLADLVSYDRKHNESNGEENRDGNDYNCSWNCGEEGSARKKKIRQLRIRQIKNAMCLLLLSQSTPLIFMGDEFGNSQKGNNNPYCQDNGITWLDWNDRKKNGELLDFWKMLTAFRREHPILRPVRELRRMDHIACGYPDLSYHGENAWRPRTENGFRHIGIMLCGKYARTDSGEEDAFLYLAINMDWVSHELALPKLPRGLEWGKAFTTEDETERIRTEEDGSSLRRQVGPRSIKVYMGRPEKGNPDSE